MSLRPWPLDEARALVAGAALPLHVVETWAPDYPLPDTVTALALLLAAHEVDAPLAAVPAWWLHQVWRDGRVVGDVGFHGPPAPDGPDGRAHHGRIVEIGYAVAPSARGAGVAGAAVGLLLAQAWADGARQVLAGTDDDNHASQAVLARHGFRRRLSGDWVLDRPPGRPG